MHLTFFELERVVRFSKFICNWLLRCEFIFVMRSVWVQRRNFGVVKEIVFCCWFIFWARFLETRLHFVSLFHAPLCFVTS